MCIIRVIHTSTTISPLKKRNAKAKMFSTQQQTAAANIQRVFLEKKLRYAILMSRCQSGKTGAYNALISLMLREGTIQRSYILCGSHETELRSQAMEDAKKNNPAAYARGDIQVLFRQDFAAAKMDVSNALIIVDESHLDQGKGQQLDQFLARHGISGMDGNPAVLIAKNAFIVSVDATPYSELAALAHKETPYEKHVEELAPGESYVGIDHYLYSGRLKETFDLGKKFLVFAKMLKDSGKKYALVRLSSGHKGKRNSQEERLEKICAHFGYSILFYTAAQTDVAITRSEQKALAASGKKVACLEDAPEKPTVILIRGRLRAGKVVPKKNISFVWEGAKNSNTDALVQGLAGRMCGYKQSADAAEDPMKLDGENLPHLFVPASALERRESKVVKASEMERAIIAPHTLPTKATNLKKISVDSVTSNGRTACVPLRITLPAEDDDNYHGIFDGDNDSFRSELCRKALLNNLNLVKDSADLTEEQKTEILNYVLTAPARVRNIRQKKVAGAGAGKEDAESHHQVLREVMKAYVEKTAAPNHIVSQHDNLNFIITHPCLKSVVGANPRHLYVVFYTETASGMNWVNSANLKSRIAPTNGKSIFSFSERATSVPLVAAGATGFCEANLKSPEALQAALHAYMTHWKTSTLTVSREIQSAGDRFSLAKKAFHYTDAKNNDVLRVCEKVGKEFGVKMTIKFSRGTAGAGGHFNLKTISW